MKDYKFYIVSSCLLGRSCRYDGRSSENEQIIKFLEGKDYMDLCPEISGGLGVPRNPCEIKNIEAYMKGERPVITTAKGVDCTREFLLGANQCLSKVLAKVEEKGLDFQDVVAILKEKSPSCADKSLYDGSFQGKIVRGRGVFAKLLGEKEIHIISEESADRLR